MADTTEIIEEVEMKEMLRKAILGHPDLLNVEILDKAYERTHGRKMDYQNYHEHVEDICQSLDISRQENKITSNLISEVQGLILHHQALIGRVQRTQPLSTVR